jgi:hypothetical protein
MFNHKLQDLEAENSDLIPEELITQAKVKSKEAAVNN